MAEMMRSRAIMPTTMPAMVVVARLDRCPFDVGETMLPGSTMPIMVGEKTLPFKPRVWPISGFCWQPASSATRELAR